MRMLTQLTLIPAKVETPPRNLFVEGRGNFKTVRVEYGTCKKVRVERGTRKTVRAENDKSEC